MCYKATLYFLVTLYYLWRLPIRKAVPPLSPLPAPEATMTSAAIVEAETAPGDLAFAQSQRSRRQLLQRVCQKYRAEMSRPILGERFLISNEHRLLYCCNAKVASTSWKVLYNKLVKHEAPSTFPTKEGLLCEFNFSTYLLCLKVIFFCQFQLMRK